MYIHTTHEYDSKTLFAFLEMYNSRSAHRLDEKSLLPLLQSTYPSEQVANLDSFNLLHTSWNDSPRRRSEN